MFSFPLECNNACVAVGMSFLICVSKHMIFHIGCLSRSGHSGTGANPSANTLCKKQEFTLDGTPFHCKALILQYSIILF